MSGETTVDANAQVSHTDERGRTLSGVGADVEKLAETMERHAPPEKAAGEGTPVAPTDGKPASGAPAAQAEPLVSRGRQRFSDLTRERDEAKAEKERLAREYDELKARVSQQQPPQQQTYQPPVQTQPQQPQYTRPQPSEDEIGTKYETYPDYIRDVAAWVYEQQAATAPNTADQVRQVIAQEREQAAFMGAVQSSQDRGRKAYPDFDAALKSPAGMVPLGPNPQEAIQRAQFVIGHPASEHIQYAILKTPGLAERLQQMDPVSFGMQIAALVPAQAPARPAWTPPAAPHPMVGASSQTTVTPSSELTKRGHDFDASGYREKRRAERAAAGRA